MAHSDLRDFIRRPEKERELKRIAVEMDPAGYSELPASIRQQS
jgi:hypothetical protein